MSEIQVRGFGRSDWESAAELFLLPRCTWGTLQLPYQSRDEIYRRFENPPEGFRALVAVDPEGRVLGLIGLRVLSGRRAHVGDIGMFVHDEHHNQGIGSRLMEACVDLADRWLGLQRLELTVYTDNAPAIHLYEKYGFEREGTHRRYALQGGAYVDSYAMARVVAPAGA